MDDTSNRSWATSKSSAVSHLGIWDLMVIGVRNDLRGRAEHFLWERGKLLAIWKHLALCCKQFWICRITELDCKGIIYLSCAVQLWILPRLEIPQLGQPIPVLNYLHGKCNFFTARQNFPLQLVTVTVAVLLHTCGKSASVLPMPGQMSLSITRTLKIMGKETWFHPSMLYSFAWNVVLQIPVPTGS